MSYFITTEGRNNMILFLIDRKKTKKRWWLYNTVCAMKFVNKEAAEKQCNKLRYKNPQVVDSHQALLFEKDNDYECAMNEVHPFSSEGLGQWDD